MVPDCAILFKSKLLGLLLIAHHLELVHLLQLGDLEGAVGLAGLHLEAVDLHVPLLDGVLHVNFSPNTEQLWSYSCFTRAARSSLLMPDTSGSSPTFSLTTSGTTMVRGVCEEWVTGCAAVHSPCTLR